MAKLYGEIASKALLTLDKSFARANGQPLDASEVYYSLAAAEEYAAGAQAYIGQKIVVIENGIVTHYSIEDTAGTLKELGSKPVGDGTTISIAEDGTISLANVSDKAEGTYNAVLVDGVLTWVKPSSTTVEGLSDLISALTERVDTAAENISKNTTDIKTITDDYLKNEDKEELSGLVTLEKARAEEAEEALSKDIEDIKKDYLTSTDKTELSNSIANETSARTTAIEGLQTQINTIMNNPDAEGAINSINEFTNWVSEHGTIAEGMRTDINKNKTDIGSLAERIVDLEEFDHSVYATNDSVNTLKGNLEEAISNEATTARAAEKANADAILELQNANTSLSGRIDELEKFDHDTYATKEELKSTDDKAVKNAADIEELSETVKGIVSVGGEANVITKISVNGTLQEIVDKTVDITVPTKFSEITDDSGFNNRISSAQSAAEAAQATANNAVSAAAQAQSEVDAVELEVGTLQTTVAGHTTTLSDYGTRLGVLEQADITHATEYSTLSGIVTGHTETIATLAKQTDLNSVISKASANETAIKTINETTIPAVNAEIAKKANSTDLNNYYTKNKIGSIADGKTVVQMIADAQTAATYNDTEIRNLINSEKVRAEQAESNLTTELAKTNAAIAAILDNDDEESLNSLKELASWIENHGKDAANMVSSIEANTNAISAINNETTGILALSKEYTNNQIAAIPAATAEALGLVKYDNSTIKMNDSKQLYIAKVSTDVLEMGTDTIVLNGGNAVQ